jgi:hypothetical protein
VRQVPYRVREVIEAIRNRRLIFFVEGEKDVESLRALCAVATCNIGGAGAWKKELNKFFKGADGYHCVPDDGHRIRPDAASQCHYLSHPIPARYWSQSTPPQAKSS